MNRRSDRGPSLGSRWFCAAHLPERENRPTPPASVSFPRGRRRIERPVRRQDRPLPLCTSSSSMIPSLLSVGKSVFRARPEHAFSYAAAVTRPGCPSNTENRHAVSRILAGTKQHAPGSRSNILPGSAPALRGVILYPFSPLPLPLTHPITLTPNMERTRMRQHLLHIPAQTLPFSAQLAAKWARTPAQDSCLRMAVPEVCGKSGMGVKGTKKGPRIAPRPLKILCDAAHLCVRIGATGGTFFN